MAELVPQSVLLLGKSNKPACLHVRDYLVERFASVTIALGSRGEDLPAVAREWEGDWILSFLSPWIVPPALLSRARRAAINFHPAPPEYPGTGCTNFAIYDGVERYGVTCHHMTQVPDTGPIIAVKRFAVFEHDSVAALTERSYLFLLELFHDIVDDILLGRALPESAERWTRPPLSRRDFEALRELRLDMSESEIVRRVRAVTFPGYPGAYFRFANHTYLLVPEDAGGSE